MTEVSEKRSGTQVLRPRARILRTLGDELISSELVAIIELVKNAYDADATGVLIRFEGPLEKGRGRVDILDNGHGMSLETIRETWMEPATLYRRQQSLSEIYKRRVLGEKGIGRFAASRLADSLEVLTRRIKSPKEVRVFFDWGQFDNSDTRKIIDVNLIGTFNISRESSK
ncbi:MAG: ATP-binding protein, partial [Desulfobacterales bacterium]|nr:ATP-binding protein [Desulfobacterales bacterium]